jgi:hypothetical protein
MRVIDGLKLFGVIGVISLAGAGAANAKDVTKIRAHGLSAFYGLFDGTNIVNFAVTRDDTNTTAKVTNFNFQRQTCDETACTGIMGVGQIPNSEFQANEMRARLNVNLAAVAGYQAFSFVRPIDGEEVRTPITPPSVNIEWKPLTGPARLQTSFSGTQIVKQGSTTTKTVGNQTFVQASVTGTLAGVPIVNNANSSSSIATNENVNITITRD